MAKYLSQDGVLYLMQRIKSRFVAQEEGKGLSENNLTDELLQKILNAGDSSFTGNYEDLTNKPFIPSKTSDLTNDAGFQTGAQVVAAIGAAGHLSRVIVTELPQASGADEHVIYMLQEGSSGSNRYTEWMVIEGAWEQIGSSDVDLSGYLKVSDMVAITNVEIDNIITAVFA